jgi:hypothetical protein
MLQQKERVVSVGHSRETGKKLATTCRSLELRWGGGKGRGLATHLAVIQSYNHRKRLANIWRTGSGFAMQATPTNKLQNIPIHIGDVGCLI